MATLAKPEMTVAAFIALNLIVFTETGLLIGFFLPGDSLLVTAGLVASSTGWNLPLLIVTLVRCRRSSATASATRSATGPGRASSTASSRSFRKDHLLAAQAFYERHGGKTIILARFMPIIRTFAPVVAGVGRMNYRAVSRSSTSSAASAGSTSMILLGYSLPTVLDPLLKALFGDAVRGRRPHREGHHRRCAVCRSSPGLVAWARWRRLRKTMIGPASIPRSESRCPTRAPP